MSLKWILPCLAARLDGSRTDATKEVTASLASFCPLSQSLLLRGSFGQCGCCLTLCGGCPSHAVRGSRSFKQDTVLRLPMESPKPQGLSTTSPLRDHLLMPQGHSTWSLRASDGFALPHLPGLSQAGSVVQISVPDKRNRGSSSSQ